MKLPHDLRHFRADPDRMRQLAVSLCATAAVMLTITAHTMSYQDELLMERARAEARRAGLGVHYASIVAACMRGEQFLWVDPHTGKDKVAFCDIYEVGVAEWRKVP